MIGRRKAGGVNRIIENLPVWFSAALALRLWKEPYQNGTGLDRRRERMTEM
jgi:hypothetical protein